MSNQSEGQIEAFKVFVRIRPLTEKEEQTTQTKKTNKNLISVIDKQVKLIN